MRIDLLHKVNEKNLILDEFNHLFTEHIREGSVEVFIEPGQVCRIDKTVGNDTCHFMLAQLKDEFWCGEYLEREDYL